MAVGGCAAPTATVAAVTAAAPPVTSAPLLVETIGVLELAFAEFQSSDEDPFGHLQHGLGDFPSAPSAIAASSTVTEVEEVVEAPSASLPGAHPTHSLRVSVNVVCAIARSNRLVVCECVCVRVRGCESLCVCVLVRRRGYV